jgi:hypothetical protein
MNPVVTIILFQLVLAGCRHAKHLENKTRILLMPDQGKMHCNVVITENDGKDIFALTIPETIGCREGMILNFPSTNIRWKGPNANGVVHTSWTTDSLVSYSLTLAPAYDFVDAEMTITNLTNKTWRDVWSFNCLNPVRAEPFKDTLMQRTYMSTEKGPLLLSKTKRVMGPKPTIGVYFREQVIQPEVFPFVSEFHATSPNRTNGNYLVTLSESGNAYMAATSPNALFLFNNLKFKCIHSAPNFGNIEAGESKAVTCRFYFAEGNLDDFIDRYNREIIN